MLGLISNPVHYTRPHDVQPQSLSAAFRDGYLEYGMVVLDISDLDNIGYGIVGFPFNYMAEVWVDRPFCGWDPIEDPLLVGDSHIALKVNHLRLPTLRYSIFLGFGYQGQNPGRSKLAREATHRCRCIGL